MTNVSDKNNSNGEVVGDNEIEFKSNTHNILSLLEEISLTTDSLIVQTKINVYLKNLLDTPHVIIVPLLPESEEGLIQVINDRVLEKEFRFSVRC